jgi:hypothetical protein
MDTIKIDGTAYPVKFGLSVIRAFARNKGFISLDEFEDWYTKAADNNLEMLDDIATLLLLGIKRGCKKDGIECGIDTDDILDLMQGDPAEFAKLQTILQNSVESEADETQPNPKAETSSDEKK